MNWQYKHDPSREQRRFESDRIRRRYPDRIPVIVQPLLPSTSTSLFHSLSSSSCSEVTLVRRENEKFLVPSELSFGQFAYNIRRRLRLRAEHALFFYIGSYSRQPMMNSTMEVLYHENKDTGVF